MDAATLQQDLKPRPQPQTNQDGAAGCGARPQPPERPAAFAHPPRHPQSRLHRIPPTLPTIAPMTSPTSSCPLVRSQVVDRYFLEHRAKLLDIAAFLDRVDRAGADAAVDTEDFRLVALRQALEVLLDGQPARRGACSRSSATRRPNPFPPPAGSRAHSARGPATVAGAEAARGELHRPAHPHGLANHRRL